MFGACRAATAIAASDHPFDAVASLTKPTSPPDGATAFADWIGDRQVASLGTNAGASPLAFQRWHRFKEAFPPELVRLAVDEHPIPVRACLDPFGGSGTTALASQFLGIESTTVEVNPFLIDLIEAKIAHYDADELARNHAAVRRRAQRNGARAEDLFSSLPATFIEPGADGRWIFSRTVADALAAHLLEINRLDDLDHRRLLRVLLGGSLIELSNVVVNGKGRRYRRNWESRSLSADDVVSSFDSRVQSTIADVHRFGGRSRPKTVVVRGDARRDIPRSSFDLAVFSPPYPNSFDYTDVYNVELWMLGYLNSSEENRSLRSSTLTSHVQLHRNYRSTAANSPLLVHAVRELERVKSRLWSPWIPSMVGGYFADMETVLAQVLKRLRRGSRCWMVVGDSRYGGVFVPTGRILAELADLQGWSVTAQKPFRSMRSSAQHGGRTELAETLLVLEKH